MGAILESLPVIEKLISLGLGVIVTVVFLGLVIFAAWKYGPLVANQNTLIENNTIATNAMSQSISMLGSVLKDMTTNFAVHDQRAADMQRDIMVMQKDVVELKQSNATKHELAVVHARLDSVGHDVARICGRSGA